MCVGKRENQKLPVSGSCISGGYYRTEKKGPGPVSKFFYESLWLSLRVFRYRHATCASPVRISFHFLLAR